MPIQRASVLNRNLINPSCHRRGKWGCRGVRAQMVCNRPSGKDSLPPVEALEHVRTMVLSIIPKSRLRSSLATFGVSVGKCPL